jgi:hypothetical protein
MFAMSAESAGMEGLAVWHPSCFRGFRMDFSVDPIVQTVVSLSTRRMEMTANLASQLSFERELAALQMDTDDSKPASPTLSELMPPMSGSGSSGIQIPSNQLAAQNNNPGNLRFAGQSGAAPGAGGFAQFSSPEAGYQALIHQVQLDAGRGETLAQYIAKYAPPSENDTALYIRQASQALEANANTPLALLDPNHVAAFQAQKESGTIVSGSSSPAQTSH